MLILVLKLHNKLAFIPFFSVTNILSCRWLEKKIGIKSYLSSDRRRKIGSCFYWRTEMVTCISGAVSKYHLSMHNGHIYAKIMHFRPKKHGRFWQFQGFPLIMHYLKVIKPTVQLKMPFKSDSNIQKYVEFFACLAWNFFQLKYPAISGQFLKPDEVYTF